MLYKKTYGSTALDGDLEKASALALSSFKTGRWVAAILASELKEASQLIKLIKGF